jgi:hypothetical protein
VTESLEFVAFDIETTGFAVTDTVTVVGFAVPMGVRVFCRTDGRPAPDLEVTVTDRVEQHVSAPPTHPKKRCWRLSGRSRSNDCTTTMSCWSRSTESDGKLALICRSSGRA